MNFQNFDPEMEQVLVEFDFLSLCLETRLSGDQALRRPGSQETRLLSRSSLISETEGKKEEGLKIFIYSKCYL